MRIRFSKDREVRDHLGIVTHSFRAGEVVELSAASARRWIKRMVAEEVPADTEVGVHVEVPVVEVRPREPDPFETPPLKEHGGSHENGPAKPSSVSPPAPASQTETSDTSGESETKDDAGSSASTEVTSDASGPTFSTEQTQAGGGRRRTRRASKGGKSASKT